MQNLINELEHGTLVHPANNTTRRAAKAIKELIEGYNQAHAFRMLHQDIEFDESLDECKEIINEVVSQENLECIS